MKRTVFLIVVMATSLIGSTLMAQPRYNNQCNFGGRGANPEAVAYIQENVIPVIKVQRQDLDTKLDAADRERLAEIRSELKTLRTISWDKRESFRDSDERPTVAQRQEMRDTRNNIRDLRDEVEQMSEKYDAEIAQALDSFRDEMPEWRSEIRGLCPNNGKGYGQGRKGQGNRNGMGRGNGNMQGKANCMGNGPGGGMEYGPRGGRGFGNADNRGMPLRGLNSPVAFLLWDSDEALPFMNDGFTDESGIKVNIFPNPAGQGVQVSLSIDKDASLTIEVLDKDGKPVIESKKLNATQGIFTHTLALNSLNNGIYFVKIKMGSQTLTERLIIQK